MTHSRIILPEIMITPTHMGVWEDKEGRAEPYFIWGFEQEEVFSGKGIDREGRFTVEGPVNEKGISLKKVYTERGPNHEKGFTVHYIGDRKGKKEFQGRYYCGELPSFVGPEDGAFNMESYTPSRTLNRVVLNLDLELDRYLTRRERAERATMLT